LRISEKRRVGCHGPKLLFDRTPAIQLVWEFLPPIQSREFRPRIESEIPQELIRGVLPPSSLSPWQESFPRKDILLLAPQLFHDSQR
jgi:hypothetical protein